jgi:hypothetical protein
VPAESETSFVAILKTLAAHRVEFIIVGGVAAVLQGASLVTFDLDLVHSRAPENLARLLAALGEMDARGHQLLMTRFGPLDLLGEIGHGHGYDDLLQDAVDFETHPGVRVHALRLRRLIAVKRDTASAKDLAALPLLERTLDESERS